MISYIIRIHVLQNHLIENKSWEMTIEKEAASIFLLSLFGGLEILESPIWCMMGVVWARAGDLIWRCCESVAITLYCCWLELQEEVFYSCFLLSILLPGGCTWGWCLKDAGKKPCWECKRLGLDFLLQC